LDANKLRATPAPLAPSPAVSGSGVDVAGMDRSVVPGNDFFRYANGAWMKATEIPPDRGSWGTAQIVDERTSRHIADLSREAATSNAPAGSDARKIGDYYETFMDAAAIDAKGLAPLAPKLGRIAAITDAEGLARYFGSALRADVDVLNNG